jgi:hypothetical protein
MSNCQIRHNVLAMILKGTLETRGDVRRFILDKKNHMEWRIYCLTHLDDIHKWLEDYNKLFFKD